VFVALAVLSLALTLLGLGWVRVYDSQLARQTEAELIAQGAVLAHTFAEAERRQGVGAPCVAPSTPWPFPKPTDSELRPILPTLTAASKVEPPVGDAPAAKATPSPSLLALGRDFEPTLIATARATLASARIVDTQGTVIATSGIGVGVDMTAQSEVRRALAGSPASTLRERLGEPPDSALESLSRKSGVRVFVALPIAQGPCVIGAVVLARTPMTWAKATYADRWTVAGSTSVVLGVLLLVSLAASAFVLRPIRLLVQRANAIRAGETPSAALSPGIAELHALSESLDAMARTLAERNDALRAFAASVSHEFKTPLASIRGAIELLQEDQGGMPAEQRARFMKNVGKDADRLTRLVQRLLELAKAEAGAQRGERCDVLAAVKELADARITVTGEAATAPLPKEALQAALGHLIENAFGHGGTKVEVIVAAGAVTVSDDGPGISAANRAKIFDTFFTTARESGGTGMGLSICRALMRAFGGDVALEDSAQGARFRVTLPR
jgi:signal transduction histidine kinase